MRIWGYTPDRQQTISANVVYSEAEKIKKIIERFDSLLLAKSISWVSASTNGILANLHSGEMRDVEGKTMDQGAAYEDLIELSDHLQAVIKIVEKVLSGGFFGNGTFDLIQNCYSPQHGGYILFKTRLSLHNYVGDLKLIVDAMNGFLFPIKPVSNDPPPVIRMTKPLVLSEIESKIFS